MPETQHIVRVSIDLDALTALVSLSLLVNDLADMVPEWQAIERDVLVERIDRVLDVLWDTADVKSERQGVGGEKVS